MENSLDHASLPDPSEPYEYETAYQRVFRPDKRLPDDAELKRFAALDAVARYPAGERAEIVLRALSALVANPAGPLDAAAVAAWVADASRRRVHRARTGGERATHEAWAADLPRRAARATARRPSAPPPAPGAAAVAPASRLLAFRGRSWFVAGGGETLEDVASACGGCCPEQLAFITRAHGRAYADGWLDGDAADRAAVDAAFGDAGARLPAGAAVLLPSLGGPVAALRVALDAGEATPLDGLRRRPLALAPSSRSPPRPRPARACVPVAEVARIFDCDPAALAALNACLVARKNFFALDADGGWETFLLPDDRPRGPARRGARAGRRQRLELPRRAEARARAAGAAPRSCLVSAAPGPLACVYVAAGGERAAEVADWTATDEALRPAAGAGAFDAGGLLKAGVVYRVARARRAAALPAAAGVPRRRERALARRATQATRGAPPRGLVHDREQRHAAHRRRALRGRTSAAEIYAANRHRLDGLQHLQKKSGKPANFKPETTLLVPLEGPPAAAPPRPYDCAACRGRNVKHACAGVFVGDPARWRRRGSPARRVRLEGRRPPAGRCALAGHGDAPAYDSQPDVGDGLRVFRGGRARAEVASRAVPEAGGGAAFGRVVAWLPPDVANPFVDADDRPVPMFKCASAAASSPGEEEDLEEAEVVSSLAPVRDDAAGADDDGSVAGPEDRRIRVGATVAKKFAGYGSEPWRGRIADVDVAARRCVVEWSDESETRESFKELTRCFDRAEGKPAAAKAPKAKATAPAPKRAAPPPPPPCDECRFCLDKPRNGGPGRMNQACVVVAKYREDHGLKKTKKSRKPGSPGAKAAARRLSSTSCGGGT
ncbi:hypothetical protein SO694_00003663 [Aureococcus anophagefferens]|uniref:MBD domain-containing protein n=1 Tax=Aureococcus anophagefferens TaxID=44056 RepID=A0ABR1GDT8_AURAN